MPTLTLNLDDRHDAALEALAAEQDMSKTAVMRQALRLYQLVHLRAKDGQQLAFTKHGQIVPLLVPSMFPLVPTDAKGEPITDSRCEYLFWPTGRCDKCGNVHDGKLPGVEPG